MYSLVFLGNHSFGERVLRTFRDLLDLCGRVLPSPHKGSVALDALSYCAIRARAGQQLRLCYVLYHPGAPRNGHWCTKSVDWDIEGIELPNTNGPRLSSWTSADPDLVEVITKTEVALVSVRKQDCCEVHK